MALYVVEAFREDSLIGTLKDTFLLDFPENLKAERVLKVLQKANSAYTSAHLTRED